MPLLTATNLTHRYGDRLILKGISISIEPTDRIGIVGRNGAGKTTLMKALTGELKTDEGNVNLQRGSRAGYLHQDHNLDPTETLREAAEGAFEKLHNLHRDLNKVYDAMATADAAQLDLLLKKQARLEAEIEAEGGYAVDHKIDEILHGLGFTDSQFNIKVASLSGGQKGRLALAKLLLEQPDLLLLDEPTNHLDIEGRLWLENFLSNEYKGAVVMISHDRYLLDAVVTRIIEVEQCRLIDYPGNYEAFRELRYERRLAMSRAYENQQTKFKKEEAYIRKYKAGQRARQAKGRESKLERQKEINSLERPMEMEAFRLRLPKAERTGDVVASARGLSKKYLNDEGKEKVLFHELDLSIARGERWGIIGPNGAGKTTLVRCILSEVPADAGVVRIGSNVKVGYYHQTHEKVPADRRVFEYLQGVILKEAPQAAMSEQAARNLAGAFLFSGEEQDKLMGSLSGGERSRAVLAGLLASAKNVLVLDEPTNHLDIPSAERLEEALALPDEDDEGGGFDGTLILISHDRALIDATCDHLLILDGKGNAEIFMGAYTEWFEKHQEQLKQQARSDAEAKLKRDAAQKQRDQQTAQKAAPKPPPPKPAPERPTAAPAAKPTATPVKQAKGAGSAFISAGALARLKTDQLEERIEKLETRIRAIDADLSDPAVWRDANKSNTLGEERSRLLADLEPLEFEWARRAEEDGV